MEMDDQEYADTGGSGVMVSNLPLLFSRGSPSSLYEMNQSELEVFVPFMVRCSVGEERPVPWSHLPRPPWWPKKLPFRMPPSRNALIGLVERCYSFHGCDYLLQFCASLVAQMPPTGYRFNDNRDGTTSMIHGSTGKLLVTFRNENRDYDKFRHGGKGRDATKKLLLSPTSALSGHSVGGGGGGGASTAMIQPPVTDIYLCDKCENEFYSLKEVQAHERHCCGESPPSSPTPSPEPDIAEEEPEPTAQVPFLSYFNLRPAQHTGLQPHMSPRKKSVSSPPAKLPGPIYPRYDTIALTSPLGRYLFANSKFRNKYQASQHSVMRYERHLHATPNAEINFRERCTSRWIVVWRNRKEQQPWVHLYSFNRAQRRERMITIRTGMNRESRRLLRLCRPLYVRMKRLPKRTVDRLMRLGGPTSAPCIDLTDEQQQQQQQLVPQPLSSQFGYWMAPGALAGQNSIELQWLPGLPPEQSSLCLPSGSGSLPPHYTTQLGVQSLMGLSVAPHSSLDIIPLMAGNTNQQQQQQQQQQQMLPGITLQPSALSRLSLPVSNNSHFKAPQNPSPQLPLLADVSISPVGVPAQPTERQLAADAMRPRCKKKYPDHQGSSTNQLTRQQQQQQQGRAAGMAFPAGHSLDWERMVVPPTSGAGNSLFPPLTLTNSSIEVIDLSSDDDDYGRVGRGRSEAANAPQQLDGLACYPHTGAKVPSESSEFSLSKNGNSHWSSRQKSHCGAGRVGDLATNGQPPNVLPSPPRPRPSTRPQGPQAKANTRKRKSDEDPPPPHGSKTIVLDISSRGVVVSQDMCPPTPNASPVAASKCSLPWREGWRATERAVVPPSSLPCHSANPPQTNLAAESSNSLIVDEDVSFKTPFQIDEDISFSTPQVGPQESGRLCHQRAVANPQHEAGPGVRFLTSLVTRGVELFKSLMGKESEAAGASLGNSAGLESHQCVVQQQQQQQCITAVAAAAKRNSEVQNLLRDECRELQRGGLRELRRLDLQGVRLTRRSVGRILPVQPSRKTQRSKLRENRPPHRNGSKVRRETKREATSWSAFGIKSPAPLGIDENGNSASYVQAGPKQPDARDCSDPAARVHNGRGMLPITPWEWQGGVRGSPFLPAERDSKVSSVGKSTVFSDISATNIEGLESSCSDVWGNSSVTCTLEYKKCSADLNTKVTNPTKGGAEKTGLNPGSAVAPLKHVNGQTMGRERHVCGPKGKAMSGLPWGTGGGGLYTSGIKKTTHSPRLSKDVPSHGQTATRPELMGETAEECGAQLALCPLPDQQQHHPGVSSTPPNTPPQRPRLTLLNSARKEHSPPGHSPPTPELESRPYLSPPAKPQSTNRRKGSRLIRELINLSRDEYKEIRGTGFHPSDLVGCEEVKYLSVSSDEDEAPSPVHSHSPAPRPRDSSKKPPLAKVSKEVAKLLGDECKELRGAGGRLPKAHRDRSKDGVRWRSMHPLASLTHSTTGLLEDDKKPRGAAVRCSTRFQASNQPAVQVFTPRDTHRHLLQSEVAMCVLNYKLPNIH